ncbi:YqaJ domain-containing protein [Aphis craccivora]|uniref:YqaJ domain-containing protein n=1 Tax=Aphis craccivora TaxID=307492 RepID=A0A6G0W964_APHCR|nr:YqaJ domain-containing protein [Aphis craccivora]
MESLVPEIIDTRFDRGLPIRCGFCSKAKRTCVEWTSNNNNIEDTVCGYLHVEWVVPGEGQRPIDSKSNMGSRLMANIYDLSVPKIVVL